MKPLMFRPQGRLALALCFGAIYPLFATDYQFGSTTQSVAIPLADCTGGLSTDGNVDDANDALSIYWRGSSSDSSYLRCDLSSLQSGISLGSPVSLNWVVNATCKGSVTGSQISTANGPWTAASGTTAHDFKAIRGTTHASSTHSHARLHA